MIPIIQIRKRKLREVKRHAQDCTAMPLPSHRVAPHAYPPCHHHPWGTLTVPAHTIPPRGRKGEDAAGFPTPPRFSCTRALSLLQNAKCSADTLTFSYVSPETLRIQPRTGFTVTNTRETKHKKRVKSEGMSRAPGQPITFLGA